MFDQHKRLVSLQFSLSLSLLSQHENWISFENWQLHFRNFINFAAHEYLKSFPVAGLSN